jgi:hypothetical protein
MEKQPPRWALTFFRWFCHRDHREELEGDLMEQFHDQVEKLGVEKARSNFKREVLLLFRPSVILTHQNFNMKTTQWIKLIGFNLLVVAAALIPFIPGPFSNAFLTLSLLSIAAGFFGLLLIPIAVTWLVLEIRALMRPHEKRNNWNNGYYLSIAATVICVLLGALTMILLYHEYGTWPMVIVGVILLFLLQFVISGIKKLKQAKESRFHVAPVYMLSIPVVAFLIQAYAVQPVSEVGRGHAIERSASLINAIEDYKIQHGEYPASLDALAMRIPKPGVMGIAEFQYIKYDNDYTLFFIQHQHFYATQEVVIYNKNNEHRVKGHFAAFNAGATNWRYYWLD